jgi:prepilin-type N-terminal cleavage/methylation domain-containing protein
MEKAPSPKPNGFTLIELLIAMTIFMFLGMALISLLRSGLRTWRAGEERGETLEIAQAVLGQISSDLDSIYTEVSDYGPVRVKLIADYYDTSRHNALPRLRFVRTTSGELQKYLRREAGTRLGASDAIDEHDDFEEARGGGLKATGGLCEVAYALMLKDPSGNSGDLVLCRSIHSPIGNGGSLFDDGNLTSRNLTPLSDRVLYFGFRFWTQYTNNWSTAYYTKTYLFDRDNEKSGPKVFWDSTRGTYRPGEQDSSRKYQFLMYRGTPHDASDDIFPSLIKIILVVKESGQTAAITTLARNVEATSTDIYLTDGSRFPRTKDDGFCYVCIEGEWIKYRERRRNTLTGIRRGVRGTKAMRHRSGARAETGRTFSMVIKPPSFRENWDE